MSEALPIPPDLRYTSEHEWLRIDGDVATVGITAFAAQALGDVVFVELPETGTAVADGESCGEIESTKSVSELYAPVDGAVVETNQAVVDDPAVLNSAPYDDGWLIRVRFEKLPDLLDAAAYTTLTENN